MSGQRKHWSELGRVKNSDWYRRLPEVEQRAVLAALEHDTHESAVKFRAALAIIYSVTICASAFAVWAAVLSVHVFWFGVAGGIVGGVVGLVAGNVIVAQKTPQHADAMQRTIGAFVGVPELALLALGLGVLIIRQMG
jgi:hypothetical protein